VIADLNMFFLEDSCEGVSLVVILIAQAMHLDVAMLLRDWKEKDSVLIQKELQLAPVVLK